MRLEAIRIRQLPGIHPELALGDLAPGVNLVTGPNASGKSSIIRALRYLLAGSRPGDPHALFLEARLAGEAGAWTVRRTGSAVVWERDGRPADPPLLPDPAFFHCYWLAVEDLLADRDNDRELVARLRRELTGGYDLESPAARGGPFFVAPRHGGKQASALHARARAASDVQRAYEALDRQRRTLAELERRIREGTDVPRQRAAVDRAVELLEARRARVTAEAALKEFPASPEEMSRVHGDELDELDRLEERRRESLDEQTKQESALEEAEGALRATGLEEGGPEPELLDGCRASLQAAREALRDRDAASGRLRAARSAEDTAAERLGAPDGARPRPIPSAVSDAEELAVELQKVRSRIAEAEARLEQAPEPPDPATTERHRQGVSDLRRWLAAGADDAGKLGLTAGGAFVLATAGFAASLAGARDLVTAALALAAAAATGTGMLVWRARSERAAVQERFLRSGLDAPTAWTVPEVDRRIEALDESLAELRDRERRAALAAGDRETLERTRAELERLESARRELAERVGFDPEKTAGSLHEFVRLVDALDGGRRDAKAAVDEIAAIDTTIRERVGRVRAFLAEWGAAPEGKGDADEDTSSDPPDADMLPEPAVSDMSSEPAVSDMPPEPAVADAEAALARLAKACGKAEQARNDRKAAARELVRLDGELARNDEDRRALFERVGIEPDDRRTLETRLDVRERFEAARAEEREASIRESQLRAGLKKEEELLALVEADDEEGLRRRRDDLEARAEALEEARKEHTKLSTRLNDAGQDHELEQALGERDEARGALEHARNEALFAAAGRFLLEDIRDEHRTEHEPAVLRDARERFERFTHHAWSLELDADEGLRARDRRLGDVRRLSQLSSGTRMQLLLAVRVAWTRTLEAGREPLPLFLDEALTTSDPERFARVAESLEALAAEEGRQVFYLCAQPSDVQLWERAAGHRPHVVDLADLRTNGEKAAIAAPFALPEREPVPAPDGTPPEEYAVRLGVPFLAPWKDPGATHLFHLLRDDLARLHRLIEGWRVTTQGQLEALMESPAAAHAEPDADVRSRLAARCRIARVWIEAWRRGRGRPVDRGVLEASGVVTDTFIDRVAELAEEGGGDPEALLEALPDVPRFRSAKVEELRAWLDENEYLSPEGPLDRRGREARVLEEAAGLAGPAAVLEVVRWLEAGVREGDGGRPGEAGVASAPAGI